MATKCVCKPDLKNIVDQEVCCKLICASCNTVDTCATCEAGFNRVINVAGDQCICDSHYFEPTPADNTCAICDYYCLNCNGTKDNCTSCNAG